MIAELKTAYSLWHKFSFSLAKPIRFGIGSRIESNFLEVLENSFLAEYSTGERKTNLVGAAIIKLDVLKFLLQIAWENGDLEDKQYIAITESLSRAGKMLAGWKRFLEKQKLPHPAGEMK